MPDRDCYPPTMTDYERGSGTPGDGADRAQPGISWEPGDEDYPFKSTPGESALDYFARWLADAGYERIERDGIRYIHEADVANVVNHLTADVDLLRARLRPFGDRIITADRFAETTDQIEEAVRDLAAALESLRDPSR